MQVCWTTHRTKWSNTNVMDTKLKVSLSCRKPSVTFRSSVSQKSVTRLDQLETLFPTYWSTSFTKICHGMKVDGVTRFLQWVSMAMNKMIAVPMIPELDLVKEDQDMKTRVETELCGVQTTETKISRNLDTSSFNKDTEPLYSRKTLHAT